MNESIYLFEGLGVRIVGEVDQPMFVAADVCRALEICNHRDAVESLSEDEKGVVTNDTLGGEQKMLCVTEAGLYRLIFRSRKASAERFRRWIFHEVLPQIRRTGVYRLKDGQMLRRCSILQYLRERFPGTPLPPRSLVALGREVRKMAYAMGVRGLLLEDDALGEALAWPIPFLDLFFESLLSGKKSNLLKAREA